MINQFLKKEKINFEENVNLSCFSYFKTGGNANLIIYPNSENQIQQLIFFLKKHKLKYKVIGFTSNILFLDEYEYGLFISLERIAKIIFDENSQIINVTAGYSLGRFVDFCVDKGISGFECLEGIPGTLGGALRMNAGAMGWEIFDMVEWVKFLMPDGKVRQIQADELEVGYRYCREAYDGIALRAKLRGEGKAQHLEIRKLIDQMSDKRRKHQPQQASSGCVFRNPENHPAGWLIDQAGLKGEKVGGAGVSEIHGNFIVNHGGATSEQVIELIQRVKKRVKDSQGVILEPEVNLLGESWNQYLS